MRRLTLNILFILLVCSCAGIKKFDLETTPNKADVYAYDMDQKKYKNIGQTPLSLDKDKVKELISPRHDFIALRIEKTGHVVEHIIVDTKTKHKVNYLLNLKPIEIWADREGNLSSQLANDIAKKVQSINRNIIKKELDLALTKTNQLIEQYPKAYIFYDIKGSIHLLKGNNTQGIASLKKSLKINPDNVETEQILNALANEGEGQ